MKYTLPICLLLAMAAGGYGQESGARPRVAVHVRVVEVSLTRLERLHFDLAKLPGNPKAKPETAEKIANVMSIGIIDDGSRDYQTLEALRKGGNFAKTCTETTIVATSGKPEVFDSGDKLAIPKQQPDGSVAIDYQFSTHMQLTADVLGDQTVRLSLQCAIAEVVPEHTVRVGKDVLPAVRHSDCVTDTKMQIGQTLVINGPTQIRDEAINVGLPIISEIPYIGAIFPRKTRVDSNEIATFIMVRPEIVQETPNPSPLTPNP